MNQLLWKTLRGFLIKQHAHLLCVNVQSLSHVRLFVIPRTGTHHSPPFIGFSRQEYWSGLPLSSLGDLPDPDIKLRFPALQADSLPSEAF